MMDDFRKYATKHLGMNSMVLDDVIKSQAGYLNPYILEERQLNVTQLDVFSRLMMDRIIFLGTQIDDYTAASEEMIMNLINDQINNIESYNNQDFLSSFIYNYKKTIEILKANRDQKLSPYLAQRKTLVAELDAAVIDLEYYMQQNEVKELKTNINISLFLEKRVEFFNDLAVSKDITFYKSIEPNIEIFFNEIEAYRIIDNNLSNAIKYSKNSSNIYVSLKKEENSIKLIFKDEGIGIKDTSTIFERYYRGDKITGGFGIGLSIVKNICIKNSIKIDVESKENFGTTFIYTFNL
jgi:signal transduction histidine kinase